MIKNIKWIITGIILAGIIALFMWGDNIEAGSAFAGLAVFIAAIKSRLFGSSSLKERISEIEETHSEKRENWEEEKKVYEQIYEEIKMKMDTLQESNEILKQKLDSTRQKDYQPQKRNEEEILEWLNKN